MVGESLTPPNTIAMPVNVTETTLLVPAMPSTSLIQTDQDGSPTIDLIPKGYLRLDPNPESGQEIVDGVRNLTDWIMEIKKLLKELSEEENYIIVQVYRPIFEGHLMSAQVALSKGFNRINLNADLRKYPDGVYYMPGQPVRPLENYQPKSEQ